MIGTHLTAAGASLLDVMSTVLLVAGAGVVLTVGALVVAVTVVVRRVRRSATLALAALRFHAFTDPWPRREVARLRLRLRRTVDGGDAAVGVAAPGAGLPGEAAALLRRIRREAAVLDQQLRVLQTEEDRPTLRAALPAASRRVDEIVGLVRRLRAAVADGLAAVSDASMADLGADVEREVVALRAGRDRLRHLDPTPGRPTWTSGGAR
jgi:hypothetical protein